MFTGLVETTGIVTRTSRKDGGAQLEIYAPDFGRDMAIGDSVAVNGACLTIAAFARGAFVADVSLETLDRTNLGAVQAQQAVNLERAMRLSDRLGGHLVTGHIDGTARFLQRHISGNSSIYQFEIPERLAPYLVEKGSIALDGVSLTIARMKGSMIACSVLPLTQKETTLGSYNPEDVVNVEVDLIAKYVRRFTTGFTEESGAFTDYQLDEQDRRLGDKLRNFLEG